MKRIILIALGFLNLTIGIVGIILPVLPTTPFVLLAAACFTGSSPHLAHRLESSKLLGAYLRNWRTHEGVPIKTKRRAILWLWVSLIISALIVRILLVYGILLLVGIGVTIHLLMLKTKEPEIEILTPTGNDPTDA